MNTPKEGNLEAPTRHPIDWKNPDYFSEELLNQELEISAKKEIITILDEPLLPIDPSKPRKLLNLIISIFLSGIIGIFTVLIYDYIKKGLKTIK